MTPLELLQSVGAFDVPHSGRRLVDHLTATRDLLAHHGYGEDVCRAGMMHSVYGTSAFRHRCVDPSARSQIRQVVGERAEHLAWLFSILARPATLEAALGEAPSERATLQTRDGGAMVVDRGTLLDLCAVEAANLLDQHALSRFENLQAFWRAVS